MAIKALTVEQHRQVLSHLLALARTVDGAVIQNTAGPQYTSLMVCFLLHLRLRADGMQWSQRAREFDVANVFRHAAFFLTCYLKFFGKQFGVWEATAVERCWEVKKI